MARKPAQEAREILGAVSAEIDRLPIPHLRALIPIMTQAESELARDLTRWLRLVPDGEAKFTAQQYRVALVQMRAALRRARGMSTALFGVLDGATADGAHMALGHLARQAEKFNALFGGSMRALPFQPAAILASGESLRIRRIAASAQRYGEHVAQDIQRQLAVGMVRGETFAQMTRRIQRLGGHIAAAPPSEALSAGNRMAAAIMGRNHSRAEMIVRSESVEAYNVAAAAAIGHAANDDPDYMKRWDATLDQRGCLRCRALHNVLREHGKEFPGGLQGPTLHPRCFPAGTPILTGRGYMPIESIRVGDMVLTHRQRWRAVVALSRQHSTSDIVALHHGGHVLRATTNHPFLSPQGWVEAERLCVAGAETYVLEGLPFVPQDAPAERQQMGLLGGVRSGLLGRGVPAASVHFDGDQSAGDGHVDAVLAHGEGRNRAEMREGGAQGGLGGRVAAALFVPGPAFEQLQGPFRAAHGDVAGLGLGEYLCPRHRAVSAQVVGALGPHGAGAVQDAVDRATAAAVALGEGHGGLPAEVEVDDLLVGRQVDGLGHVRMVSVHPAATREAFDGEVFNFQVDEDESYIAGAFVVHNCRCALTFWHRDWGAPPAIEQSAPAAAGATKKATRAVEKTPVAPAKVDRTAKPAPAAASPPATTTPITSGKDWSLESMGNDLIEGSPESRRRAARGLKAMLAETGGMRRSRMTTFSPLTDDMQKKHYIGGAGWDGVLYTDDLASMGADMLAAAANGDAAALARLGDLFHEGSHMAAPGSHGIYRGVGVLLEETTAEVAARSAWAKVAGRASERYNYNRWISRVEGAIAETAGISAAEAAEVMRRSSVAIRQMAVPLETSAEFTQAFCELAFPGDVEKQRRLAKLLRAATDEAAKVDHEILAHLMVLPD